MKRDWENPQAVIDAVRYARRTPGWNNRQPDPVRFELPNRWGHESCELIVVPARQWVDRRWERRAAERRVG